MIFKISRLSKIGIKNDDNISNGKRKLWSAILFSHIYLLFLTDDHFYGFNSNKLLL
jgi:hypothetical protein